MSSASGGFDRTEPPPPPERRGRGHRLVVTSIVITLAAAMMGTLAIPGAALLGRMAGAVNDRLAVVGPGGEVVVPAIAQRSVVLSESGEVIATLTGEENRRVVPLAQVAPIARQAVIAIEDARFYDHRGVDGAGVIRALVANAKSGRVREGGSTITQQLVKNVLVGTERTLDRKIREAQYAVALEKTMRKNQILELYLNETYFGDGVYGIETAAEYFFGIPAAKLNAVQAALLAGLIARPEAYNPFDNPKTATSRRNAVLNRMAGERYITHEQAAALSKQPLGVKKHPLPPERDPYFVDRIKQQLLADERLGPKREDRYKALFQGGLRIETTLNLSLQDEALAAISGVLDEPKDPAAALVSVEAQTGQVRAIVGGQDFSTENFNFAIGNNRQAGSVFKPFVMTAALNEGISPALTLDTPSPYRTKDQLGKPWEPKNYSGRGEGLMDMRKATELSVNSYYVQLIERLGPQKVVDMAAKLGITSPLKPYPSLALGTLGVSPYEMASAYGTLANGGVYCRPYTIRRVVGADGKEILRNDPSCKRVVDATIAATAVNILEGVITRGTGRRNGQIGRPAAGKTGTTDDYTDAWFIGFTPQFSTAVWLGYPEGNSRPLKNIHGLPEVFGGSLPAQIWNRFMKAAHKNVTITKFPEPPKPQPATVPDVVGLARDEAVKRLEAAGFGVKTVIVSATYASGLVVGQSPEGGTKMEKGSIVLIEVSDGSLQTQEPTPDPTPTFEPTPSPSPSPTPTPTQSQGGT